MRNKSCVSVRRRLPIQSPPASPAFKVKIRDLGGPISITDRFDIRISTSDQSYKGEKAIISRSWSIAVNYHLYKYTDNQRVLKIN
jgi:hypothetical protein